MKWNRTSMLLMSVFLTASVSVAAEESGPWGFRNIAVVNLPTTKLEVSRSLDHRGVELKFAKWTSDSADALSAALAESPLRYRMFPSRQSEMFVEIFSATSEVDFASKPQRGGMQLIIGEVRREASGAELLNMNGSADPIPEAAALVRAGKYTAARHNLYENDDPDKPGGTLLFKSRIAIIDFIKGGTRGKACPKIQSIDTRKDRDVEALLLDAWCETMQHNTPAALHYCGIIKKTREKGLYHRKATNLERRIVAGRILAADRLRNPIRAAAFAVSHVDLMEAQLSEVSFVETVAANLIEVGLAGPLSKLIQNRMARDASRRSVVLEPLLVETYLSRNQVVPALDSAGYFLTKRQPAWNSARLKRGLGLARLQTGDWKGATAALESAKRLGAGWGVDESLSLIEARLRSGDAAESINNSLEELVSKNINFLPYQKSWFTRISQEADLERDLEPTREMLDGLPSYALYKAALRHESAGRNEIGQKILSTLAARDDGWREAADAALKTAAFRKEIAELKRIMEQMQ